MIEEAVLKKIGLLSRAYREKEKAFGAEHKKLQEYVERYLDENSIRNDMKGLKEVAGILPDSRILDSLISRLYDLELKEKEQQPAQEGEQRTEAAGCGRETGQTAPNASHSEEKASKKSTLKEVERQARICQEKDKGFRAGQKKLHQFVEDYLDKNGIRDDMEKLDEVIGVLPGGILRFRLMECKYTRLEKQAEQQRMQEAVEMQEGADEPQVPGGTQTMGMG